MSFQPLAVKSAHLAWDGVGNSNEVRIRAKVAQQKLKDFTSPKDDSLFFVEVVSKFESELKVFGSEEETPSFVIRLKLFIGCQGYNSLFTLLTRKNFATLVNARLSYYLSSFIDQFCPFAQGEETLPFDAARMYRLLKHCSTLTGQQQFQNFSLPEDTQHIVSIILNENFETIQRNPSVLVKKNDIENNAKLGLLSFGLRLRSNREDDIHMIYRASKNVYDSSFFVIDDDSESDDVTPKHFSFEINGLKLRTVAPVLAFITNNDVYETSSGRINTFIEQRDMGNMSNPIGVLLTTQNSPRFLLDGKERSDIVLQIRCNNLCDVPPTSAIVDDLRLAIFNKLKASGESIEKANDITIVNELLEGTFSVHSFHPVLDKANNQLLVKWGEHPLTVKRAEEIDIDLLQVLRIASVAHIKSGDEQFINEVTLDVDTLTTYMYLLKCPNVARRRIIQACNDQWLSAGLIDDAILDLPDTQIILSATETLVAQRWPMRRADIYGGRQDIQVQAIGPDGLPVLVWVPATKGENNGVKSGSKKGIREDVAPTPISAFLPTNISFSQIKLVRIAQDAVEGLSIGTAVQPGIAIPNAISGRKLLGKVKTPKVAGKRKGKETARPSDETSFLDFDEEFDFGSFKPTGDFGESSGTTPSSSSGISADINMFVQEEEQAEPLSDIETGEILQTEDVVEEEMFSLPAEADNFGYLSADGLAAFSDNMNGVVEQAIREPEVIDDSIEFTSTPLPTTTTTGQEEETQLFETAYSFDYQPSDIFGERFGSSPPKTGASKAKISCFVVPYTVSRLGATIVLNAYITIRHRGSVANAQTIAIEYVKQNRMTKKNNKGLYPWTTVLESESYNIPSGALQSQALVDLDVTTEKDTPQPELVPVGSDYPNAYYCGAVLIYKDASNDKKYKASFCLRVILSNVVNGKFTKNHLSALYEQSIAATNEAKTRILGHTKVKQVVFGRSVLMPLRLKGQSTENAIDAYGELMGSRLPVDSMQGSMRIGNRFLRTVYESDAGLQLASMYEGGEGAKVHLFLEHLARRLKTDHKDVEVNVYPTLSPTPSDIHFDVTLKRAFYFVVKTEDGTTKLVFNPHAMPIGFSSVLPIHNVIFIAPHLVDIVQTRAVHLYRHIIRNKKSNVFEQTRYPAHNPSDTVYRMSALESARFFESKK